jgi:hypothetical protein
MVWNGPDARLRELSTTYADGLREAEIERRGLRRN